MSKSSQGLLWSFFGVLILSPDTLLIRLLNLTDFSLIFYRSFLPAVTIFLFLFWFYKRDTLNVFLSEHKKDFCCIIAGYEDDIKKCFLKLKKVYSNYGDAC